MSTSGSGSNVSVTPGSTPSHASCRVYSCVVTPTSSTSDSLVQYVSPPPAKNTGIARVTGSRVHKNDEGYAILQEKRKKAKRKRKIRRENEKGKIKGSKRVSFLRKGQKRKQRKLFCNLQGRDASDRIH